MVVLSHVLAIALLFWLAFQWASTSCVLTSFQQLSFASLAVSSSRIADSVPIKGKRLRLQVKVAIICASDISRDADPQGHVANKAET